MMRWQKLARRVPATIEVNPERRDGLYEVKVESGAVFLYWPKEFGEEFMALDDYQREQRRAVIQDLITDWERELADWRLENPWDSTPCTTEEFLAAQLREAGG